MNLLIAALKKSNPHNVASIPPANAQPAASPPSAPRNAADFFSSIRNKYLWASLTSIPLIIGGVWLTDSYFTYRETTGVQQDSPHPPALAPAPHITSPAATDLPYPRSPPSPLISSSNNPPMRDISKSTTMSHSKKSTSPPAPQISPVQQVDIQSTQETDAVDLLLTTAYAAYQNGDYASASRDYQAALARAPQNRDALLGLAVISQQQEKDTVSVNYYRQVLVLDPRDPLAHAGLASFDGNDSTSRENRLKQLILHQPDEAALHLALGYLYTEQSRWPEAQQAYFNALTMEPGNALFAFNLAVSLDHLGQHKSAAKYYRQALDRASSGNAGFDRIQAERRLHQLNTSAH